MFLRTASFLAVLALLMVPANAADAPAAAWKFENPFCSVVAQMGPLAGGGYGLAFDAASGSMLDAHVTLIGQTDAFDAYVHALSLSGPGEDRESDGVLVKLPNNDTIDYFFVDSYAIDGGQPVVCPSYVFAMGNPLADSTTGAKAIVAQPLQLLGPLSCGKRYEPPDANGDLEALIGSYGGRALTMQVRVYLDSKGHAIDEKILQSTGVAGVDSSVTGIITGHQFIPARFLCTPVVGQMVLRVDYRP
jgi:hypothetical protein